jgi:hypothetical protein
MAVPLSVQSCLLETEYSTQRNTDGASEAIQVGAGLKEILPIMIYQLAL